MWSWSTSKYRFAYVIRSVGVLGIALPSLVSSQSHAQQALPHAVPKVVTPAEYAFGLDLYSGGSLSPINNGALVRPDSIVAAIEKKLSAWIEELQARPVKGLQLDPYGELFVGMGKDQVAIQQFEERLSTPGLSEADKAYTLRLAVSLFANPEHPTRMEVARKYLARLDALSDDFITSKYAVHEMLAKTFRIVGATDSAVAHARHALSLGPRIPLERRQGTVIGGLFMTFADLVSGQPDGRRQIDSMGTYLLSLTRPTAAQIAQDSAYYRIGRSLEGRLRADLRLASHLGKRAPNLIATHWINTSAAKAPSDAAPGATQMTLADGKIRLFEYGSKSCGACMVALPAMDRIRKSAPEGVEVWYVTSTVGFWGTSVKTPEEEVKHLDHFYRVRKGYGLPIAVWAGPKDSTIDGGVMPRMNPNFTAYPIMGTPTFVVTDGAGIVRHIAIGYSRQMENMLSSQVQYLVAEAARKASVSQGVAQ